MSNLELTPYEYQVTHNDSFYFTFDDKVFLKSNPKIPMRYIGTRSPDTVLCEWYDENGIRQTDWFKPESVLQYEYAGLVILNDKYYLSLN